MPVKLLTTLENVRNKISNAENRELIFRFYEYLKSIDTSENYQNGIIKAVLNFCEFIGADEPLLEIKEKELILRFPGLEEKKFGFRYRSKMDYYLE